GNIIIDDLGEPRILDFGLARLLEADISLVTNVADASRIVGTLAYMSPEQARGQSGEVDNRNGVYSPGGHPYEMLTGKRPYEAFSGSLPEAIRSICDAIPTRPSMLHRALRGDLETIALKALEKEPARRYQSTAELADDIGRFLSNQPITARA